MNSRLLSLFIALCFTSFLMSCAGTATDTPDATDTVKEEKKEEAPAKKGYDVGDLVEDFSMKGVDGKMVSLESLGDVKGATVVFTCNTCPYAVKYEDRLVELSEKAQAAGYPIIAIMPNSVEVKPGDSYEEMQKRAKDKKFNFAYVMDNGQRVYPKFGATKTPEVYVLNKTAEGFKVAYHGAIDDNHEDAAAVQVNYVTSAYAAIAAGKPVDPGSTKAIGCSIKVKKMAEK